MTLGRASTATAFVVAVACSAVVVPRVPKPLFVREPKLPVSESAPPPSHPTDPVKAGVFDRINADRAATSLPPVAWDEAASRVADAFCAAQVAEGTTGHFLTNGMPPYSRTAFAGIFGMGSENAVAWRTTGTSFRESDLALALSGQADMMHETPPNDGHRRTILDPDATHVGVGWAQKRGSFRMAEEFLTRRLSGLSIASDAGALLFRGRAMKSWSLEFVTLAHEPTPAKLTPEEARSRTSYTYPEPELAFVAEGRKSMRIVGAETDDRIRIASGGDFTFRFAPTKPGLWTIVFYLGDGRAKPRPGGLAVLWMEKPPAP